MLAYGSHQQPDSLQYPFLTLDGKDHGEEGQPPTPLQGLAV